MLRWDIIVLEMGFNNIFDIQLNVNYNTHKNQFIFESLN